MTTQCLLLLAKRRIMCFSHHHVMSVYRHPIQPTISRNSEAVLSPSPPPETNKSDDDDDDDNVYATGPQ